MSSKPKVPAPPGLSPQELDLINQQKLSLEQFQKLLSDESLGAKETQDLLKNLSGLYKSVDIPESRGADVTNILADRGLLDPARYGQMSREFSGIINDKRTRGGITSAADVKSEFESYVRSKLPTAAANDVILDLERNQGGIAGGSLQQAIDKASGQIENSYRLFRNMSDKDLIGKGFSREEITPGAITPARREMQLDQDEVAKLRQKIQDNMAYQESLSERDKLVEEKAGSILDQLLERQSMALEGKLPVDPALVESKKSEFKGVVENLRRRGYDIIGDDPETAVGIGTPAVQTLDTFKKRYNLVEDASRRGELDSATGRNIGAAGLVSDLRTSASYNPSLSSLNFLQQGQQMGPSQFMGAYPALTSGYANAAAPYAGLRDRAYNTSVQNAALSSQRQAGLLNLAGTGLSSYLMYAALTSTKSAKKNIVKLTAREENKFLDLVRKGNVYTFDYKDEKHGQGKRIGIIAEEAPEELVTKDRKAQDVGNTLNILLTSVRALDRKVERMRLTRRAA